MRSIFRYPGGKTRNHVKAKILRRAPDIFDEYREPFVGGGGIFFGLEPCMLKKRWINDINEGLMSVYLALRDRPDEFIALCRAIAPPQDGEPERPTRKKGKKYNSRLMDVFDEVKYNEHCDQAFRYFFINRTVWAGRVTYDPKLSSRMYFSNPTGWNIVGTTQLEEAANWISGTQITSHDYAPLLLEPGENVWIYCDPPYLVNTDMPKTDKLYEFGFTEEQHLEFVETVKKSPHQVCISYDDDKDGKVRSWFLEKDGFHLYQEDWAYAGTSSSVKKIGKELIITNYPAGDPSVESVGCHMEEIED